MLFSMTKRYQQIAVALYASVLLATLFYALAQAGNFGFVNSGGRANPPPGMPIWVVIGNIGIFLLLSILEGQLSHKSLPDLPRREAGLHLGLRFLLVTLTIMISRAPFSVYMLYPILLFTFFTFGRKVAYRVALVSCLIVMVYVTAFSPRTLLNLSDINNLFVFLLGMLMVLLLANALYHEWETSRQLQQAHNDLGESHAQLQAYAAQVATLAATDERNRLARDIHDSLGHHLAATSIQLEKAAAYRQRDGAKSAEALDHARRTIREALGEVRTSVRALRDSEAGFELIPALNDLMQRMSHHDLVVDFNVSGDSEAYSTFIKMTLYRIVQEGLTNMHKHAYASQATIDLSFAPSEVTLKVADNGRGFEQVNGQQGELENGRFGLQGIQERVALIGGSYEIKSELQKGTVLFVTIPKKNEAER